MWSRVVEAMLGCWLLISPFLFGHQGDAVALWVNDFACGAAVIAFSLLSYWRPTRHAHLMTLGVGTWLVIFAYLKGFGTAPPASQSHLILGLLLVMFAVIPNEASRPTSGWDDSLLNSKATSESN